MPIDLAVSRAVTMVHALEMAVHDNGPWSLELDGMIVPARRSVGNMGVTFTAIFPSTAGGAAYLRCRDVLVWTSGPFEPADRAFEVEVELSLSAGVSA
jgi:hypothetical protein